MAGLRSDVLGVRRGKTGWRPPERRAAGEMCPSQWKHAFMVTSAVCVLVWVGMYNGGHTVYYPSGFSPENSERTPLPCRPCQEHTNLAFVKVHKAGGTTLTCLLQRFGDLRNLSFVLPRKGINLGWPKQMSESDFLPSLTGEYNILVQHVVFNKSTIGSVMPRDTKYITTIREPFSHLKSVFNWYKLARVYRVLGKNPVGEFLKSPAMYEARRRDIIPSKTRNFMAFDLGFPIRTQSDNDTAIKEFISKMDEDFVLVIILEHLDESLVLLKRYLCWSLSDILYWRQNKRNYQYKGTKLTTKQRRIHQKWSNVDYALYNHFNATLWKKIEEQGPDFWEEVRHFEALHNDVMHFCQSSRSMLNIRVGASRWNEEFYVDSRYCAKLKLWSIHYLNYLRKRYYFQRVKMIKSKASVHHVSVQKRSHCFSGSNNATFTNRTASTLVDNMSTVPYTDDDIKKKRN
ncbi:galactose-3-O-sulfotransferase 2-like [Branchiostoma floridae]|uniref:Galactose-3-O-sulfotransferase 2-like n=1 Tax=Branchiostoma floridae TaxID=7739 RepID=C3Y967_BRAFL|nr:galactose-3-O-sulfotransferase 2-like [Branchiostoma floridae]|eukprot:XP_002607113.1 hypothetical protein BRAFLDRAFT_68093 [Branchiostoma floridae]